LRTIEKIELPQPAVVEPPVEIHTKMLRLFKFGIFAAWISQSAGSLVLLYPPSVGSNSESTPPCGGSTADSSKVNITDFHVGGDTIAVVRCRNRVDGSRFIFENANFTAIYSILFKLAIPRYNRLSTFWKLEMD